MTRTRFAPTPSGYLHRGNAVNAVLCAWWAQDLGASLALRVDDLDRDRSRPEYRRDIDEVLAWLGIACDLVLDDQASRMGSYAAARDALIAFGEAYACSCSRSRIAAGMACDCASLDLELATGRTALRWRDGVVVWRRDGIPAYHLASVVDDDLLAVTHIMRGEDLAEATAIQVDLARVLGLGGIATADVRHHPLLADDAGAKLSKSRLPATGGAGPMPRTSAERDAVLAIAATLAPRVGVSPRTSC